jgi:protein-S-isoprenylcysteine O-methyltransferase Ste14
MAGAFPNHPKYSPDDEILKCTPNIMEAVMLESLLLTLPPASFLIILFGGGALLRRRNIDMDGSAPINKPLFATSKYAIVLLWTATVACSWGWDIGIMQRPAALRWIALILWFMGFALLFIGRLGLGENFRIGSPKESTRLKVTGLFSLSRNPMYVGVYSTLLAAILYTLQPLVLIIAAFIIAVHHKIVLAEEKHLRQAFGIEYEEYCCRVRRYI